MAYQEFDARPELADLVVCTWQRPVPRIGGPSEQRVIPDGCVDLVWFGRSLGLAGPDTHAVMSPLEPGTTVVGLRLRPGIAGVTLGLPASELCDARPRLDDVWGRAGEELAERIGDAGDPAAQRRLLEEAVLARRTEGVEPDRAVLAAVSALGLPRSRVRTVGERVGLSERQLLRRFRAAVGHGPKMLDRVLRFQRFLERADTLVDSDEPLARIAFELGYADQAHLTRESVQLSGLTPAMLARTQRAS